MNVTIVEQGSIIQLSIKESQYMKSLLKSRNLKWDYFDEKQCVMKLPQQYVGYIQFENRKLIIKPKHPNVTIGHIIRIYYFLYSAEYSDLDSPKYDLETGNDFNIIKMFVKEMMLVVQRGIPVEYIEKNGTLDNVKGRLNVIKTKMNISMRKESIFNCDYDDLSRNIPINKVLISASKKIEGLANDSNLSYVIRQFGEVDYLNYPETVMLMKNTMHCKQALSLAYMILNDLIITTTGEAKLGESLLINFDKVFERFIQKILMEYSRIGNFTYWTKEKQYATYQDNNNFFERSFIPDLLYEYKENVLGISARAIIDMKNKVSKPFDNPDIYEMSFYAQMLHTRNVILCYPSSGIKENSILRFIDNQYYLQKVHAIYFNLLGDEAKDFKENIQSFIQNIEQVL